MEDHYNILEPCNFTQDHLDYIDNFKKAVAIISSQSDVIFGAKDVNSRHIISTNSYAKIVGLTNGNDVTSRLDKDMPCDGTAKYAEDYVKEDLSLMQTCDPSRHISVLNVHNYSDGLKARLFKKHLFKHSKSHYILGTVYSGFDIKLENILNIIPSHIIRFGATGSLVTIDKTTPLDGVMLTDYEQEICFLILLNWEFKQIANFMNETRPTNNKRTADTIIKKKNYICEKFGLGYNHIATLQEFLVSIGFHNKMPLSFYNRIIGSTILEKMPVGF